VLERRVLQSVAQLRRRVGLAATGLVQRERSDGGDVRCRCAGATEVGQLVGIAEVVPGEERGVSSVRAGHLWHLPDLRLAVAVAVGVEEDRDLATG
jgi:hypothetical protein